MPGDVSENDKQACNRWREVETEISVHMPRCRTDKIIQIFTLN